MTRLRRAALAGLLAGVVAGVVFGLAGSGTVHRQAVPGGGNGVAPTTVPPAVTPSTAPTSTAPSTTTAAGRGRSTTTLDTVAFTPPAEAPTGGPAWTASRYIQAYYSISWTYPTIGYWTRLIGPYASPANYAAILARAKRSTRADEVGNGDVAYFDQVRASRTNVLVYIQRSAVIREAPNTATVKYVLVTYEQFQTSAADPNGSPLGPQTLQCTVTRAGGRWGVASCGTPFGN